jgi:hypothetical protein
MKELLLELLNRLEQQDLKLLNLSDHLGALQATFDHRHPEAIGDRVQLYEELRPASDSAREALDSHYEEIRRLISKLPD